MNVYYRLVLIGLIIGALSSSGTVSRTYAADEVPRMTKEVLKEALGDADLVILDVRKGKDWKASEFKIKGAIHAAPDDFNGWQSTYDKEQKIVLYCA
jgi:hypothetical protein